MWRERAKGRMNHWAYVGVGEFVGIPLLFFQPISLLLSLSLAVSLSPWESHLLFWSSLSSLAQLISPLRNAWNSTTLSFFYPSASFPHLSVLLIGYLTPTVALKRTGLRFSGGHTSKKQTSTLTESGDLRCLRPDLALIFASTSILIFCQFCASLLSDHM